MYYVYVLMYPDLTPFYVGKGTRRRIKDHVREARTGKKSPKCSVIRKILSAGESVVEEKVAWFHDEERAFFFECWLIRALRLNGIKLTNQTDGGEGASGHIPSEETREKMRRINKGHGLGQKFSPERISNISKATRGKTKKMPPSQGKKISALKKGKPQHPSSIAAARLLHTKQWEGLVAPDGTEYRNIVNLREFALSHGLNYAHTHKVATGQRQSHKGWRRVS